MVLENTLESPLDYKEIKSCNPKGNQPWLLIGRTDAEAEVLILWPPDVKDWLIIKDPDARRDIRQEEKGTMEDEMVRWHHRLNGHEFEQAPRDGKLQGSLASCSPWDCKESGTTDQLNNSKTLMFIKNKMLIKNRKDYFKIGWFSVRAVIFVAYFNLHQSIPQQLLF